MIFLNCKKILFLFLLAEYKIDQFTLTLFFKYKNLIYICLYFNEPMCGAPLCVCHDNTQADIIDVFIDVIYSSRYIHARKANSSEKNLLSS